MDETGRDKMKRDERRAERHECRSSGRKLGEEEVLGDAFDPIFRSQFAPQFGISWPTALGESLFLYLAYSRFSAFQPGALHR